MTSSAVNLIDNKIVFKSLRFSRLESLKFSLNVLDSFFFFSLPDAIQFLHERGMKKLSIFQMAMIQRKGKKKLHQSSKILGRICMADLLKHFLLKVCAARASGNMKKITLMHRIMVFFLLRLLLLEQKLISMNADEMHDKRIKFQLPLESGSVTPSYSRGFVKATHLLIFV